MANSDELICTTEYRDYKRGVVQTDVVITGFDCIFVSLRLEFYIYVR